MSDRTRRIRITTEGDVIRAVLDADDLCKHATLRDDQTARFKIAVSELAQNIVRHAGSGTVQLRLVDRGVTRGLEITARDAGPGIADREQALQDHFSSAGTLGLGLPGVRRLMDDFELVSAPGEGTCVTATLWR